jgi:hypothetical protein
VKNLPRILWAFALTLAASSHAEIKWHFSEKPDDARAAKNIADSMGDAVADFNLYANYTFDIPVSSNPGVPTADSTYHGGIRFGGAISARVAHHEICHWLGTGTYGGWGAYSIDGRWFGTAVNAAIQAYEGPSAIMSCDRQHFWPYGWNYDSEAIHPERQVGLVGAFRRDMGLSDETIGIAAGTYRLRNRASLRMLDNAGSKTQGSPIRQGENGTDPGQQWNVALLPGGYFTIQNVASGENLDATKGPPVVQSAPNPTSPSQQWQLLQTDSGFFKIVNRATGKCLGIGEEDVAGAPVRSVTVDEKPAQQWKFVSPSVQTLPAPGVISQGRLAKASSLADANREWFGNDGVADTRWIAADDKFPQWWSVDLGAVQPIGRVEIDWPKDRTFSYRIETSDDGTNYTTAVDKTAAKAGGTTSDKVAAKTRYVRVTVTGANTGGASITDLRVFGDSTMQIASQDRFATASSSQSGYLPASGNDGNATFTRWAADKPTFPQWWCVDLGSIQQIGRAVITWFDSDSRAYKYKIEGSTNGSTFTTLADRTSNEEKGTTIDTFSARARYVRVTITGATPEGGRAGFTECQIFKTASSDPNFYPEWIAQMFPKASNPLIIGPQADPDRDGLVNILEFGLGLNPSRRDIMPWIPGRAGLPIRSVRTIGGVKYFTLSVRRPIGREGIVYVVTVSDPSSNAQPAIEEGAPMNNRDGTETILYRDPRPMNPAINRIFRIRVDPKPSEN